MPLSVDSAFASDQESAPISRIVDNDERDLLLFDVSAPLSGVKNGVSSCREVILSRPEQTNQAAKVGSLTQTVDRNVRSAGKSMYLEALALFIHDRRSVLGLSQSEVAKRVGWTPERIANLEDAKCGLPTVLALSKLATALESSLFELLHAIGLHQESTVQSTVEAADRDRGMALLYALQRIMAVQATALKETLEEVSDIVADVVSADKLDAMMYQAETKSLVALGTSNTPMGRLQHQTGLSCLPLANGGREVEVFETGRSYASGEADDDPLMLPGMTEELGVRSFMAVPLEVTDVRKGVLVAASSRPDQFGAEDLPFFETVARWVALVAHRAELTEQLTAEAVQAARHVTAEELTTVLAHDLGNHLTPLKGHLEVIRRKAQRDGQGDYVPPLDHALAAVTRMGQLAGNLLDAARLEHGLFALSLAEVDVVSIVKDVGSRHESLGTPIRLRLPDQCVAVADSTRLGQAVENLITNAIQHSPADGSVKIEVRRESRQEGEWLVIEVEDQGPGIASEIAPAIFSRFSKGSGSNGLGLGLYLARGIAEAHGGSLTVESTVGQGSAFRLAIPASVSS